MDFREERNWARFHNPKDLAISINLEAAELLELFQWSGNNSEAKSRETEIAEELADVMIYCIYLADRMGISIADAIDSKITDNNKKYPVYKSRGNSRKYTEL